MPSTTVQQGHSGTKKVPHVCKGCNNGWMSRMENRTRPILMPLIQGLFHPISTFDQQYLATWIAKTVMVGEYIFPKHIAVPDKERLHMYANLSPPENWTIWIADYRGSKWRHLAMYHHQGRLRAKPPEPGEPTTDTHVTSIGMGHIFIQVAACPPEIGFDLENDAFRRIWPRTNLVLSWPPARPIHDTEADYVANSLMRISKLPHEGTL